MEPVYKCASDLVLLVRVDNVRESMYYSIITLWTSSKSLIICHSFLSYVFYLGNTDV